jgi:hypothetical protein
MPAKVSEEVFPAIYPSDIAQSKLCEMNRGSLITSKEQGHDYDPNDNGTTGRTGEGVRGRIDRLRSEAPQLIRTEIDKRQPTSFSLKGRPGSVFAEGYRTTVRGVIHYGKRAGLNTLAGSSNGTGIKGPEQARLKERGTDPYQKQGPLA